MDFPNAFMLLRSGSKVGRAKWQGGSCKCWVSIAYADVATSEDTHMVKMKNTGKWAYLFRRDEGDGYAFVYRWHPSVEDLFAEDWELVD